jgi:Type I restriction enzyme R protein N terminus (HSDR_N)
MFENFDFSLLENEDFKEDSVREEIIVPIIKQLGYSASGKHKIVRSKALSHPYVSIGSQRIKLSLVPDYLFLINEKPYWVLDAKSPKEELLKSKHAEQAYSYSIHPEVRARYFALCNGKEFLLYDVNKFDPVLHFYVADIWKHWEHLYRILHPNYLANSEVVEYYPDYGIHLARMGFQTGFGLILMCVHTDFIGKVADNKYTTITNVERDERSYAASFDFDESKLRQLMKILPKDSATNLMRVLMNQPFQTPPDYQEIRFGIIASLGEEIYNNAEESYRPFEVVEFLPYYEVNDES